MSDLTNPKFYLENMPVAYCVIKIVTDDKGNPIDFVFTYSNKAHAELEGVFEGTFIGNRFLSYLITQMKDWLHITIRRLTGKNTLSANTIQTPTSIY